MSCILHLYNLYRNYRNNKKLKTCTKDTIELFTFDQYTCKVKIVDVYDGDTFTGCFYYNHKLYKYKFRCIGYDSPEMKPLKTNIHREKEKQAARLAKNRFIELIGNNVSTVKMGKFDKYGRILATVYNSDNISINQIMISEGHGYPYSGGTKCKINY